MPSNRRAIAAWLLAATALLGGCERGSAPVATPTPTGATQAGEQLGDGLDRENYSSDVVLSTTKFTTQLPLDRA